MQFKTTRRAVANFGLVATILASVATVTAVPANAATCAFSQGFKALHDAIPDVVGECISDEYPFGVSTKQDTSRGSLWWVPLPNNGTTTYFRPSGEYQPWYTLSTQATCPIGVFLPAGVCITLDTLLEIPQSAIDAGASPQSICESNGNTFVDPRYCLVRRVG